MHGIRIRGGNIPFTYKRPSAIMANPLLLEASKSCLSVNEASVEITAYPKESHEEGDDPDFIKYARKEATDDDLVEQSVPQKKVSSIKFKVELPKISNRSTPISKETPKLPVISQATINKTEKKPVKLLKQLISRNVDETFQKPA
jgi:hypothetical protein